MFEGANPFFHQDSCYALDTWDENKTKRVVENSSIWGPTSPI